MTKEQKYAREVLANLCLGLVELMKIISYWKPETTNYCLV